ncbi:hypothetical protein MMARV_C010P2 [viral metagenome]|uniref:Uncharacterized protein n=1 Tax=viral metagenome TaxID=1070528 RepID=A0A6L2ZKQ6_9ZZZZ
MEKYEKLREYMHTKNGIFNSLTKRVPEIGVRGLIRAPKPTALVPVMLEFRKEGVYNRAGAVPEKWHKDRVLAKSLVTLGIVRRAFTLMCVRKKRLEKTLAIGRDWECVYDGVPTIIEGHAWGNERFALMPGFAGLADEVFDRTTMNALSGLPYIATTGRQQDITPTARHAIRDLLNRDFNGVRYLWRLAVMWMTAALCELQNDDFMITDLQGQATVSDINGMQPLNNALIEAAQGRTNVIYIDLSHEYANAQSTLSVLVAATAEAPRMEKRSLGNVPTVSKFWPILPAAVVYTYGGGALQPTTGTMRAAQIWSAAELYVRQHGLQGQWAEVVEAVSVHALRPQGETVWMGHQSLEMQLPAARMSSAALGPLTQPLRSWIYNDERMPYPEIEELLWDATSRYLAMGLGINYVLARADVDVMELETVDTRTASLLEMFNECSFGATPINIAARDIMTSYGWNDCFGRIFQTCRGLSQSVVSGGCKSTIATYRKNKYMVQWEEALPMVDQVPYSAGIFATLYPVKPKWDLPAQRWISCTNIEGRFGTSDAMYCMVQLANVQAGYMRTDLLGQATNYRAMVVRNNYAARPTDHSFMEHTLGHGVVWAPVFKFRTPQAAMEAHLAGQLGDEREWFIDEFKATTFSATLADYGYPNQPTPMHAASAHLSQEAEDKDREEQKREAENINAKNMEMQQRRNEAAGRSLSKPVVKAIKKNLDLETWVSKIEEILGSEFYLGKELLKFLNAVNNPIEASRVEAGKVQSILGELRGFDPLTYAYITEQPDRAQLLTLCANVIAKVAPLSPSPDSTMDILRLESQCRQLSAQLKLMPALDAEEYSIVTGKTVRDEVKPLFTRGMQAGLSVGEIVNSDDASKLAEYIEANERLIEQAVRDAVGSMAFEPPGSEATETNRASTSGTANIPPEVEVVIPQPDDEAQPPNFGGGQPSMEPSEPPPPPTNEPENPAQNVEPQTEQATGAQFSGQNLLD